jgi:hypothetical protein
MEATGIHAELAELGEIWREVQGMRFRTPLPENRQIEAVLARIEALRQRIQRDG